MLMPFELDPVDLLHLRRKQLLKRRWCGLEADPLHGCAQQEIAPGAAIAFRGLSQQAHSIHRICSSPR
jgi:hypothetical protein